MSVDIKLSIGIFCDRDDATIDLRRELPVYLHLAGRFRLRRRRIVEVWKTDGALDLQRAVAFEKTDAAWVSIRWT
jgi:hypothetical protein